MPVTGAVEMGTGVAEAAELAFMLVAGMLAMGMAGVAAVAPIVALALGVLTAGRLFTASVTCSAGRLLATCWMGTAGMEGRAAAALVAAAVVVAGTLGSELATIGIVAAALVAVLTAVAGKMATGGMATGGMAAAALVAVLVAVSIAVAGRLESEVATGGIAAPALVAVSTTVAGRLLTGGIATDGIVIGGVETGGMAPAALVAVFTTVAGKLVTGAVTASVLMGRAGKLGRGLAAVGGIVTAAPALALAPAFAFAPTAALGVARLGMSPKMGWIADPTRPPSGLVTVTPTLLPSAAALSEAPFWFAAAASCTANSELKHKQRHRATETSLGEELGMLDYYFPPARF